MYFIIRIIILAISSYFPISTLHANADVQQQLSAQGRKIYNFHCYYCHGFSGNARTLASTYLKPPPRDFTTESLSSLTEAAMLDAVTNGRNGTAMKAYKGRLSADEIIAVVRFVRESFMAQKSENLRYHTPVNGWSDPVQQHPATPFVLGEQNLDTPWEYLSEQLKEGKRQYLGACITCHDHGRVQQAGDNWQAEAFSYPRFSHDHRQADYTMPEQVTVDAMSSATPYARHNVVPKISGLSNAARRGEKIYQENCAFCHAADGTGKNWIGSFLRPPARDLTLDGPLADISRQHLYSVIVNGLPGTSMPAWGSVLSADDIEGLVDYIMVAFRNKPSTNHQDL